MIIQERREAYNALFNVLGPDNIGTMEAKFGLAKALMDADEYDEALPLLASLDEEVRKKDSLGFDLFVFEDLQVTLAGAYVMTGHNDEAVSYINGLLEDKSRWTKALSQPNLSIRIYTNLCMMLADMQMRKQNFNESFAAAVELLRTKLDYDDAYSPEMRKHYEFACRLLEQVDNDDLRDDFAILTDDILDTFEYDIDYYSDAVDRIADDEDGLFDSIDHAASVTCLQNALQSYSSYLINAMVYDKERRTAESYELLNITLQQLIMVYEHYEETLSLDDEEFGKENTSGKADAHDIAKAVGFMSIICGTCARNLRKTVEMLDTDDVSMVDLMEIKAVIDTGNDMLDAYSDISVNVSDEADRDEEDHDEGNGLDVSFEEFFRFLNMESIPAEDKKEAHHKKKDGKNWNKEKMKSGKKNK